jgi:arylsulfatase A-like enzyme
MSKGRDERPNFLLLLPDQHRFDWLSTTPHLELETPVLDRLRAAGVRFRHAVCPAPLCAPSRACLALGMDYDRCGVPSNQVDLPLGRPTYYQGLRDAGYHVAGVGKFDLHKATRDWGLDGSRLLPEWGFSQGIDSEGKWDAIHSGALEPKGPYMAYLHRQGLADVHVQDFLTHRRAGAGPAAYGAPPDRIPEAYAHTLPTPLPEAAYSDNWIAENGRRLLAQFPADRPWHLVVNFTGPHEPVDVTHRMWQQVQGRAVPLPRGGTAGEVAVHQALRRNYSAMVENIDRLCGRLLDVVAERGELARTLVMYASDHGEMLGDHRRWGKSTFFQPSAGVPLLVAGPGVRAGVDSRALVSLHDLAATMLDYARATALPGMEARSLRPVLAGRTEHHRDVARSGLGPWRMAWDGRYKLVVGAAASALLFDLDEDPHEDRNLARAQPQVVQRLTGALRPT